MSKSLLEVEEDARKEKRSFASKELERELLGFEEHAEREKAAFGETIKDLSKAQDDYREFFEQRHRENVALSVVLGTALGVIIYIAMNFL